MPRQPPSIANPQLIVAIDFGSTGTAVSWALTSKPRQVHSIKTWPRVQGPPQASKVPQAMARINNGIWGFDAVDAITNSVNGPETASQYFENFFKDPMSNPEKAKTCLSRYLNYLYDHIRDTIQPQFDGVWDSAYIWSVFNEPSGWEEEVIDYFEGAVSETNFRLEDLREIKFRRTNPSLLAMARVYGENRRLKTPWRAFANKTRWLGTKSAVLVDNEIRWLDTDQQILVAEIGGGTFDIALFAVNREGWRRRRIIRHRTIPTTTLTAIIDEQVRRNLVEYIQQEFSHLSRLDKENCAQAEASRLIVMKEYIAQKNDFNGVNDPALQLEIKDPNGQTVTRTPNLTELLEPAFSGLCDQVWRDIERHLRAVRQPGDDRPRTIVLTGGLSNNEFVQRRLQERATNLSPSIHIFTPSEPELSVSKGLVWDTFDRIRGKRRFWNYPTATFLREGDVVDTNSWKKEVPLHIPREQDNNTDVRII
ncbi:hsp70 family chaperone [Colletotrichum sojae]|uniref:Hsp70 family chaperone n=1 Tax=Colletotrichum sojae TaxID=2175907 RepID=A0A8H6JEM7_9PEZI|nr:hsp70 family chaperone [Colletotrichum sojae]